MYIFEKLALAITGVSDEIFCLYTEPKIASINNLLVATGGRHYTAEFLNKLATFLTGTTIYHLYESYKGGKSYVRTS